MFQSDLTIITIILNSLTFFGLGYWIATRNKKTQQYIYGNERNIASWDQPKQYIDKEELSLKQLDEFVDAVKPPGYPSDGIRFKPVDEPSGIIYRPTQHELELMGEDEQTKAAKAAMAETFGKAGVPK